MKILNYGHVPPAHVKCTGCGATLEYTPHDIATHTNRFHIYYYVECPVCGKWIIVKEEPHR